MQAFIICMISIYLQSLLNLNNGRINILNILLTSHCANYRNENAISYVKCRPGSSNRKKVMKTTIFLI
jgi:hypothetical protein